MSNVPQSYEGPAVPAHIANVFGNDFGGNDDLSSGVSAGFPIISYKGKVWHVNTGGTSTLVANSEGEPRASLDLVIIKANPHISKVYYQGGYTEGSNEKPTCFSHDGVVPDIGATERQAEKCGVCPHNAWGSRITENGAKGKACADSRRVAVSPKEDLENPMLLRIPAGSLKDLLGYADMLNRRRTPYQAVVTKIGFDHDVAHQKLTFKAMRFLSEEEVATVVQVMNSDVVAQIIGVNTSPMLAAPAQVDELGPALAHVTAMAKATPAAAAPKAAPKPAPKPVAAPEEVEAVFAEVAAEAEPAVRYAAEEDEPAPVRNVRPAPAPQPAAATAKAKASVLLQEADQSLEAALAGLDFDD